MTKLTMKCDSGGFPCEISLDGINIAEYVSDIQISSIASNQQSRVIIELIPMELEIDIPNIEIHIKSWLAYQEKQHAFSRLTK